MASIAMANRSFLAGQHAPVRGGQLKPEWPGQHTPEWGGHYHRFLHNNTDKAIMESSGFEVIGKSEPIGILPAAQNLRATIEQDFPGTIKLEWDTVHGASSYIVEQTMGDPANPATAWQEIAHPQKARYFVEGLTAGTNYWFRVIPVGATGLGGISLSALRMAV